MNLSCDTLIEESPDNVYQMTIALKSHQTSALEWMYELEMSGKNGGILADTMGLGKTITYTALMVKTFTFSYQYQHGLQQNLIIAPKSLLIQLKNEILEKTSIPEDQIYTYHGRKVKTRKRSRMNDSSTKKRRIQVNLSKYFVTLTTYGVVLAEYNHKRNNPSYHSPLLDHCFHRILLDEAHYIRTMNNQTTYAILKLQARKRWCVTGTPFNNKIEDLATLCRFIGQAPYHTLQWWNKNQDNPQVIAQWRRTFVMMRGKEVLDLPPCHHMTLQCEFSSEEAKCYQIICKDASSMYEHFSGDPRFRTNIVTAMLSSIMQMRKACNHPVLLLGRYATRHLSQESMCTNTPTIKSNCIRCHHRDVYKLVCDHAVCVKCIDEYTVPFDLVHDKITPASVISHWIDHSETAQNLACGHDHCTSETADMEQKHDKKQDSTTPCSSSPRACLGKRKRSDCESDIEENDDDDDAQESLLSNDLFDQKEVTTNRVCKLCNMVLHDWVSGNVTKNDLFRYHDHDIKESTKIKRTMEFIEEQIAKDCTNKFVIFSQWTASLDLIEYACIRRGIAVVRYDGDVHNIYKRNELVEQFQKPQSHIKIFLASLQCGGVGLNLTAANFLVLFDWWWNPFVEQQAIDRVHRMGQTRPVTVVRVHVRGTIEDNIIDIQKRKLLRANKILEGIGILSHVNNHSETTSAAFSSMFSGNETRERNFGLSDYDIHRIFNRNPLLKVQEDVHVVQSADETNVAASCGMLKLVSVQSNCKRQCKGVVFTRQWLHGFVL